MCKDSKEAQEGPSLNIQSVKDTLHFVIKKH